jgi:cytidylate kinase
MGFVTVSGEPGCRPEEVARLIARRRKAELVTPEALAEVARQEFGDRAAQFPDKAWPLVAGSILARLAVEQHLIVALPDAELIFTNLPGMLRIRLIAPLQRRIGALMLEHRLERPAARALLTGEERDQREARRRRFGRATLAPEYYDLLLNTESLAVEEIAEVVDHAATTRGIFEGGLLPAAAEAQLQFQFRLKLATFGIAPSVNKPHLKKVAFGHPTEEIFANLLDFYRIRWEYEPRSFPLAWDKEGHVKEAFTPDFYLPEFDLFVELTTMKQAHVTRKNRKVKMLKSIYPKVNIQVLYQKDIQHLIFKHGLADRGIEV